MSDTRIREPFPYARACVVLVLALAGGLAVRDAVRRLWARVKEASR